MLKNRKLVLIGVVGALVLLLGGVGMAYAYAEGPLPPLGDEPFFRGRRLAGGGSMRGGPLPGRSPYSLVEATAEVTGLNEDEVVAALEEGQAFVEIADAQGVDPQEIVDTAIAEAESRLQEAVDNGRLTEDQMEQMLERLAEEIPERLEQPWQPGGPMGGPFGRFGEGFWRMYDEVAETLGLAPDELFAELHDGKTLEEVSEAHGVEMEAVRYALEAARGELMEEAIEQAVENGRMTQERADWLLEGIEQGFMPGGRGFGQGRGFNSGRGGRGREMGR
jgi:hypothetical protein